MRRLVRTLVAITLAAAVAVGAAGCGGDDDDDGVQSATTTTRASTTTEAPSTSTPSTTGGPTTVAPSTASPTTSPGSTTAPPTTTPAVPPGFSTNDVSGGSGGIGLLTDVRTGGHAGYDRVVFELERAVPGYDVGYVDLPLTYDPSDAPVPIAGDHAIGVRLFPAYTADLESDPLRVTYSGPDRLRTGLPTALEAVETGDFEAVLSWAIGVEGMPPFKVSALSGPPRLVVDIASTG